MDLCIIIPAHNEDSYLGRTLQSFVEQTLLPKKIIVVNDGSTDDTQKIIDSFSEKYPFIEGIIFNSSNLHEPGSKVVNAFYKGYESLKKDFDYIGKFDADIILPPDYFKRVLHLFSYDPKIGIAGGNLYIEKKNGWEFEAISEKTKVRGPIKLYRTECFKDIDGLKKSIGWDTVDELLAQYHGWKIKTDSSLKVKHLKPTGQAYNKDSRFKQGEAFYRMRYGYWLTFIASAKLASRKKSIQFFKDSMKGYSSAKKQNFEFIVSEEEGKFIQKLRWSGIKEKLGISKF